jgi:hypothetical protein
LRHDDLVSSPHRLPLLAFRWPPAAAKHSPARSLSRRSSFAAGGSAPPGVPCCTRTQRSWDFTLRSFAPAGQFGSVSSAPPRPTCRSPDVHPPRLFSSRSPAAFSDLLPSRHATPLRPIRMRRVRFLGFDPSVPAVRRLSLRPAN